MAARASRIKFQSLEKKQYFLSIATDTLGYLETASTCYGLSIDKSQRPIMNKRISSCFGHKFPEDAILIRPRLDINFPIVGVKGCRPLFVLLISPNIISSTGVFGFFRPITATGAHSHSQ